MEFEKWLDEKRYKRMKVIDLLNKIAKRRRSTRKNKSR